MSPDGQFQWNWWLNLFTGLSTFGAVVVALFHDTLRHYLLPPRLHIRLDGYPSSTTSTSVIGPDPLEDPIETQSLWFHVKVSNERRYISATAVQLMLLRVDEPDAAGVFSTVWLGEVPLYWQHRASTEQTLGFPMNADLISCTKRAFLEKTPFLRIQTVLLPNELSRIAIRGTKVHMRLMVQARSLQVDSDPLLIEVAWDGTWSDDLNQMARRLVVKEISATNVSASPLA